MVGFHFIKIKENLKHRRQNNFKEIYIFKRGEFVNNQGYYQVKAKQMTDEIRKIYLS